MPGKGSAAADGVGGSAGGAVVSAGAEENSDAGSGACGRAVSTQPGDAVAFHAHLFNCAQGGTPRLTWTIDYLLWPGLSDPEQMRLVRDMTDVEFDHEEYDRTRWPVWQEWAAGADASPSRAVAVERLKLLGVITSD